jgi:hypothetical protein
LARLETLGSLQKALRLTAPPRGLVPTLAALCALAVAIASVIHTGPKVDRRLRHDRATYAAMSKHDRETLYITSLGLPPDYFDWYAQYVGRGDRLFYQVQPSGLGEFIDQPHAVEDVGRYALLPAKSVDSLSEANTVVTWNQDPALLGVPFDEQQRLGLQLFFVSRIKK